MRKPRVLERHILDEFKEINRQRDMIFLDLSTIITLNHFHLVLLIVFLFFEIFAIFTQITIE